MPETESTNTATAEGAPERKFSLQKIYIKDLSFESPHTPRAFAEQPEPKVDLNISSNATPLGNDHYEVVLSVTVTLRAGDKTMYLVEIQQAGLFEMKGYANEELGQLLGSYCPNTLFAFAREAVSDLVTKGGFPPFLLAPVNFDYLYGRHLKEQDTESGHTESGQTEQESPVPE